MAKADYQLLHLSEGIAEHTHDYAQIYLPVRSPLTVKLRDKSYMITGQELGFMPPNMPHQCMIQDDLIVINIHMGMIKKGDLEILSNKFVYQIADNLKPLIELIRTEIRRNCSSMRYLYYYLYDRLVENSSFPSLQYIRDHFDGPVSVSQLAKVENYNAAYFNDWFKLQTGYTPSHFLRLYRIDKAKELLCYSGYNITEIALQVGFSSNAAFSRAFKKETGISPLAYRAQKNG